MGTVLTTPTYDGSGQATHPSVILVDGTYWMAMTPYPGADNQYENPSILTSADGTTWAVPDGLTNPIDAKPTGGFNSDTCLYHDGTTFYLFWREVQDDLSFERVYLKTSADGVTWSATTTLLDLDPTVIRALSPAVVKVGDTWMMWAVDIVPSPNVMHLRTASAASGPWSAPTTLALTDPEGRDLWHVAVKRDGALYRMLLMTCSSDTSGSSGRIIFGSSVDGETWLMNASADISPSSGWESASIYRASALRSGDDWRVWYGGVDGSNQWRIGYADFVADDFPAGRGSIPSLSGSMSAWPSMRP